MSQVFGRQLHLSLTRACCGENVPRCRPSRRLDPLLASAVRVQCSYIHPRLLAFALLSLVSGVGAQKYSTIDLGGAIGTTFLRRNRGYLWSRSFDGHHSFQVESRAKQLAVRPPYFPRLIPNTTVTEIHSAVQVE